SMTVRPSNGPAARAMRAVTFASSRKCCSNPLRADRAYRAITSRRGGSGGASCTTDRLAPASGYLSGDVQRSRETGVTGDAGGRDIERGAMVGRGAHEGEADRDVDATVEVYCLEGDQGLVVIHAECGVVASASLGMKERIGSMWPPGVDSALPEVCYRRRDLVDLFPTHGAVLAGMRIEAGDHDARLRDTEIVLQRLREAHPSGDDRLSPDPVDCRTQWKVHRQRHDAQPGADEHHLRLHPTCELAEIVCVPGMSEAARK